MVAELEPRFDVSTLGEAMLRFSVRQGDRLRTAPAYDVHVAGSEANVAYALASVGLRSSWASALPRNQLGFRIADCLTLGGVDLSGVRWQESGRVGTFFVEIGSAPRPTSVLYDRLASTAALATPDMFDWNIICDARVLHLTGITLGLSATSFQVTKEAIAQARQRGCKVSLDVNYRKLLWTPKEAASAITSLCGSCDLLICTSDDAADLFGIEGTPEEVALRLHELIQAESVVVTHGSTGATIWSGSQSWSRPAYDVEVVDRLGAGDAFAAGLLWGYLEKSPELALARGVAMAALKMTLRGDLFTLSAADVETLLLSKGRNVTR